MVCMERDIDLKKYLLKIMPLYSWVMITIMLLFNCLTYFGTRLFTSGLKHYNIAFSIDKKISFVPFFIIFYILAYVQWIVGYIIIGRQKYGLCSRIFASELIAKGIALICFIIFPTTLEGIRPEAASLHGKGILNEITAYIFSLDAPDNLFPSIHCLESWMCFRGTLRIKNIPAYYTYIMFIMTILVFASTVLVKQHVLLDVAGGILSVEIGLFISDRLFSRKIKEKKGLA